VLRSMCEPVITFKLLIELEDAELASALYKVLHPEVNIRLRGVKSGLQLIDGRFIELTIEAPDYSAFRAAVNSLLRLMALSIRLIEVLKSLT